MDVKITQGSILNNIRSIRYPDTKCFGIIISARCDLAQDKTKSLHMLTALPLSTWIEKCLYPSMCLDKIKEILNSFQDIINKHGLNRDTLEEWGPDKTLDLFRKINESDHSIAAKDKQWKQIEKRLQEWKDCLNSSSQVADSKKIKKFLGENKRRFKSKIEELNNGANMKFCLIPESGYNNNDTAKVDGIVVDLYDIMQIDIKHKRPIEHGQYDYQTIMSEDQRAEINHLFYFEDEDDFIVKLYQIQSPWTEYLLQHFANAFIRIGVDNWAKTTVENYCESFINDGKETI